MTGERRRDEAGESAGEREQKERKTAIDTKKQRQIRETEKYRWVIFQSIKRRRSELSNA